MESDPRYRILTTREAAAFVRMPYNTLKSSLRGGICPIPLVRIGHAVRFRQVDLEDFLTSHVVKPGKRKRWVPRPDAAPPTPAQDRPAEAPPGPVAQDLAAMLAGLDPQAVKLLVAMAEALGCRAGSVAPV